MELDDPPPTDAEAWNYLVQHGDHITHRLPSKVRDAIVEVLESNWSAERVAKIDSHRFGLIWSDHRYRTLVTKLVNGPGALVFDIEAINNLKQYRLEGVILGISSRKYHRLVGDGVQGVVVTHFAAGLCSDDNVPWSKTTDDYQQDLGNLFWDGGKAHRVSNRKEEFLSHLPFTEYSEAYNTMTRHPPDLRWDFWAIKREIREYGLYAKAIMVHVRLWYNPNLKEPAPKQAHMDPVYYHLKEPFRRILLQRAHADADEDWKSKAIAPQQFVIDFAKANGRDLKNERRVMKPFMAKTLKFNQLSEEYRECFVRGGLWDRLALEIHRKMPELPFQHPDPLPYNYTGSNIYHSKKRHTLKATLRTHPEEDGFPIAEASWEGALVAPEIVDLIGQEYGPDTSIEQISDPGRRASISAGQEQTSWASAPTNHISPGRHGKRHLDEDDETMGAGTDYYDTSSSTPPPTSASLGKRKSLNGFTTRGRWRSKIVKLKLPHTVVARKTAIGPSSSASDASQAFKNGRCGVDYFREQVRRQSFSPSRGLPEPSPSTSANGRKQSPIDPIPPPRRRKMVTNLPDDMFDTPPPSAVADTANRRESVRSTSQSPAMTAWLTPIFCASQGIVPITPTVISQAKPPLSEVKQAVNIVLEEFVDKLTMKEQVAAINAVRSESGADIFVMLPGKLRKPWLYNEIGK